MKKKTSDQLKILELSDIHLGHRRTTAEHIVLNLEKLIPDNKKTAELDLIIIAGDLFDRDLNFYQDYIYWIRRCVSRLLKLCKKHDIVLRVLEGTPSHDWKQSALFVELNEMFDIGCDVKYHKQLEIDYIEPLDTTILYIPDEWRNSNDTTWLEVVDELNKHGLDKVDFCVMHGCFPHQLPEHVHDQVELHQPDRYLSITRYFIFIGHIHHYSVYDRILSAGSTDRLCHGEESPKGCLRVTMSPSGEHDVEFIENTNAKVYITIDCTGLSMDKALVKVRKVIDGKPDDSHFRIMGHRDDAIMGAISNLRMEYGYHNWTIKNTKTKDVEEIAVTIDEKNIPRVVLNRDNILNLLASKIESKYPIYLEPGIRMIEEIMDNVN